MLSPCDIDSTVRLLTRSSQRALFCFCSATSCLRALTVAWFCSTAANALTLAASILATSLSAASSLSWNALAFTCDCFRALAICSFEDADSAVSSLTRLSHRLLFRRCSSTSFFKDSTSARLCSTAVTDPPFTASILASSAIASSSFAWLALASTSAAAWDLWMLAFNEADSPVRLLTRSNQRALFCFCSATSCLSTFTVA